MSTLLIWHGYLLGGTGSNIYTANIAAAWVRAGHRVVLMCQDPNPERYDWVHEIHDVTGVDLARVTHVTPGGADAQVRAGHGACTVVRSDIDGVLPVYVLDRYAGWDVRRVVDMTDDELESWVVGYRRAIAGVIEREAPEGALLNHLVPVPALVRSVFDDFGIPYVIKVHGSELEYAMAEQPTRWQASARFALDGAHTVLVGSTHVAHRTSELVDSDVVRVEEIPPGVDLDLFSIATDRAQTERMLLRELARRERSSEGRGDDDARALQRIMSHHGDISHQAREIAAMHGSWQERDVDRGIVGAIEQMQLADDRDPVIVFVGKFIRQKGAHLLLAALPIVRQSVPNIRCIMVGFGPQREGLEAMLSLLDAADVDRFAQLCAHGALLDDGPDEQFTQISTMIDRWNPGDRERYATAAHGLRSTVTFTGLVDHGVLAQLWPLCTVSVVPSILPEAFGMVSAEAAACGCIPVVSHHSGLATVADALDLGSAGEAPALHSFDVHAPDAIVQLASRLVRICTMDTDVRAHHAATGRGVVERLWSWDSIADRVARCITS